MELNKGGRGNPGRFSCLPALVDVAVYCVSKYIGERRFTAPFKAKLTWVDAGYIVKRDIPEVSPVSGATHKI